MNLADNMNVVASEVQSTIEASRVAGLSKDAACLAALIGVLSYIRVEGLHEHALLSEAMKATPIRHQLESIKVV